MCAFSNSAFIQIWGKAMEEEQAMLEAEILGLPQVSTTVLNIR